MRRLDVVMGASATTGLVPIWPTWSIYMRAPLVLGIATVAAFATICALAACGAQRPAVLAPAPAAPATTAPAATAATAAAPVAASAPSSTPTPAATAAPAPAAAGAIDLRIDCGSEADFKDSKGHLWLADEAPHLEFKEYGGEIVRRDDASPITGGPLDKEIYLTERYGASNYHIQAAPGTYRVILYNCETYDKNGVGDRTFTVNLQGKPVITDYDVCKEAGGKLFVPVTKEFKVTVVSGTLDIEFISQVQNPEINAIEVIGAP